MRWRIQITREDDQGNVDLTSTEVITENEVKKIQMMGQSMIDQIKVRAALAYYRIINWSAEAIK